MKKWISLLLVGLVLALPLTLASSIRSDSETMSSKNAIIANVAADSSLVKVRLEFSTNSTDRDALVQEILNQIKLNRDDVEKILSVKNHSEGNAKGFDKLPEKLRIKIEKDSQIEIDLGYRFALPTTDREAIVDGIVSKLANLTQDDINESLSIEKTERFMHSEHLAEKKLMHKEQLAEKRLKHMEQLAEKRLMHREEERE